MTHASRSAPIKRDVVDEDVAPRDDIINEGSSGTPVADTTFVDEDAIDEPNEDDASSSPKAPELDE